MNGILRAELSINGGLHMTIFYKDAPKEIIDYCLTHEGRMFELECDALGMSDKVRP